MSDPVLIALINNVITPIVLAILTGIMFRQNGKIKRVQDQVVNNHRRSDGTPINFREESDERHLEISSALKTINRKIDANTSRLDLMEQTVYASKRVLLRLNRKARNVR